MMPHRTQQHRLVAQLPKGHRRIGRRAARHQQRVRRNNFFIAGGDMIDPVEAVEGNQSNKQSTGHGSLEFRSGVGRC